MLLQMQAAALTATLVLLGAFGIAHTRDSSNFSRLWIIGWAFYALRFLADIIASVTGGGYLLTVLTQEATATSAVVLFLAVANLSETNRRYTRVAAGTWVGLTLWILLVPQITTSFLTITAPTFLAFGVIQLVTAYLFYEYLSQFDYASSPVIVAAMALWGIHKMDYPILRPIESIAPIGYALGALLGFLTGIGVLIFLLEEAEREANIQRAAAERSLREYETLFDNISDPVYIHDETGRIIRVNQTAIERLGYAAEEFRSMPISKLTPQKSQKTIVEQSRQVLREGSATFRSEYETARGEQFPVAVHASRIQYRGETVILGVARDISMQVRREESLEQFRRASEAAGQAIFITDTDGRIEYVNPAFEKITGYSVEEAIGRTPRILKSGELEPEYYEQMWDAILSGEEWQEEIPNRRKSGELYYADQTIAPITDEDGTITKFVAIQQDITERKERERHLRVLNRVLRHNHRNLLNSIMGAATSLDPVTGSEAADLVDLLRDASRELHDVSEKAYNMTELLLRETQPQRIADLGVTLTRLVSEFDDAYPDAALSYEGEEGITIEAHPQFERAVRELLENGIHHNKNPEPTVSLTLETTAEEVTISITDDGIGIPTHEYAVVTGEREITQMTHGSGLGLWVAYWIVRRSGGNLEFEQTGTGTTVRIQLPRSDWPADQEESEAQERARVSGEPTV